ncbi:MAG: SigB/SigF/SigG family RNA polymerase sigma factor [Solirubrobacteraceae bacterium]|nr:SigB/SigF/SigG family RNA polymerase sigma factor [Solirubrobacteraceae bacterium]
MPESSTMREQHDMRLLRRCHDHDDADAREEMVRRGLPLVRSLARPYARKGEQFEDVIQVGCVGLIKAIDRFDPYAGTRFVSFAAPNITGEIKRHFRDHCWAVHVPRGTQELDAKVSRAADRMAATRGNPPTPRELADELGESVADVEQAIRAGKAFRPMSLDRPVDDDARTLLDAYGSSDAGYGDAERRHLIRSAFDALDAREREVVLLRFHAGWYQREIAERIGVSQMQVSRILGQALRRMRRHVDDEEDATEAPRRPRRVDPTRRRATTRRATGPARRRPAKVAVGGVA